MTVLDIAALTVRRGRRTVVDDLSFSAATSEIVALMGPSGTGKTTVLRAIAGLDPIASGTIVVDGLQLGAGRIPKGQQLRDLHRRVGMVFQFHHLFAHLSALDNVWLALVHVRREPRDEAVSRARSRVGQRGVGGRVDAMPHELSGGEAQRVAIARALAVEPPVLLMDEPTASLDSERRGDLARTLRGLASEGRTILIATHDTDFARACADRVIRIGSGSSTVPADSC